MVTPNHCWKKLGEHRTIMHSFSEKATNERNCPEGFVIHLVNFKTISSIAQIFEAFSEKLTFTTMGINSILVQGN